MRLNGNVALLVVVESGGDWPSWLGRGQGGLTVVRQGPTETLEDLVSRVARTMEWADARGHSLPWAILMQGNRSDASAILARVRIAGTIVSYMARFTRGRLVLVPSGAVGGRARIQASLLADCLRFQTRDLEGVGVFTSDDLDDAAAAEELESLCGDVRTDTSDLFGRARLRAVA